MNTNRTFNHPTPSSLGQRAIRTTATVIVALLGAGSLASTASAQIGSKGIGVKTELTTKTAVTAKPLIPSGPIDLQKPFDPSIIVTTTTVKPIAGTESISVGAAKDAIAKVDVVTKPELDENGIEKIGQPTKEAPPVGGGIQKELIQVCCKVSPVIVPGGGKGPGTPTPGGGKDPGTPTTPGGGKGPGTPTPGSTDDGGTSTPTTPGDAPTDSETPGTPPAKPKGPGTQKGPTKPGSDPIPGWEDDTTDWSTNDDVKFMGNVPVYPLPKAPGQTTTFNESLAKNSIAANPVRDPKFTAPVETLPLPAEFGNDSPNNKAPLVAGVMAQIRRNSSGQVTLLGIDPDGQQLSFAVAELPKHGSLTGIAPNLKYTPAKGFTGADTFTYFANDGQANSKPAMVVISVSSNTKSDKATARKATKSMKKKSTKTRK